MTSKFRHLINTLKKQCPHCGQHVKFFNQKESEKKGWFECIYCGVHYRVKRKWLYMSGNALSIIPLGIISELGDPPILLIALMILLSSIGFVISYKYLCNLES